MTFKACLCTAMLLASFCSASAFAQRDIGDLPISFSFEKADERHAIESVFVCMGWNCTIDPGIEGRVNFSCFEQTGNHALMSLLYSLGLTYRSEGQVAQVIKNGLTQQLSLDGVSHDRIAGLSTPVMDVRKLLSQLFRKAGRRLSISPDVQDFSSMTASNESFDSAVQRFCSKIGATLLIQDGTYKIAAPKPLWLTDASSRIEKVDKGEVGLIQADQTDVRILLFKLLKSAKLSFTINPDLQGPITLQLHKLSLDVVLQLVLRQVEASYRIKDGIYEVFPLSRHSGTGT